MSCWLLSIHPPTTHSLPTQQMVPQLLIERKLLRHTRQIRTHDILGGKETSHAHANDS